MTAVNATHLFFEERFSTPLGEMRILTDEEGRLRLADWDARNDAQLARHYRVEGFRIEAAARSTPARAALRSYFAGDIRAIEDLETCTAGTPFQRAVWSALRRIPRGRTVSYSALAADIGRPSAVRAVGLANGANPIAVVVPCHRVIGADGTLTGYGGGLDRKRWLIDHERDSEGRAPVAARQLVEA
jgi:methylated-DNA-[protein]-cysteine S-methyltransferase